MKPPNPKTLSIAALIAAVVALLCSAVNARHYARVIAPRSYQFHRSFHDPFDLVSEIIRAPIYFNSMMRQQDASQITRSTPRYTVSEENGIIQLEMEIPGVETNDLEVELEDNQLLRVKGKRKKAESEFDLTFRLNDGVDPSRLKAVLSAGILQVQVPRKEKEIQRIEISTNASDDLVHVNAIHASENGESGTSLDTPQEVNGITISETEN